MSLEGLAEVFAAEFAPSLVDDYFERLEKLGMKSRLDRNDVYFVALALLFFLSQRGIFGAHKNATTYSECLCAEITSLLEKTSGGEAIKRFYGALDRIRQSLRQTPTENPHAVSLRHCQLALGDPSSGNDCPGRKLWVLAAAFLDQAKSEEYVLGNDSRLESVAQCNP